MLTCLLQAPQTDGTNGIDAKVKLVSSAALAICMKRKTMTLMEKQGEGFRLKYKASDKCTDVRVVSVF